MTQSPRLSQQLFPRKRLQDRLGEARHLQVLCPPWIESELFAEAWKDFLRASNHPHRLILRLDHSQEPIQLDALPWDAPSWILLTRRALSPGPLDFNAPPDDRKKVHAVGPWQWNLEIDDLRGLVSGEVPSSTLESLMEWTGGLTGPCLFLARRLDAGGRLDDQARRSLEEATAHRLIAALASGQRTMLVHLAEWQEHRGVLDLEEIRERIADDRDGLWALEQICRRYRWPQATAGGHQLPKLWVRALARIPESSRNPSRPVLNGRAEEPDSPGEENRFDISFLGPPLVFRGDKSAEGESQPVRWRQKRALRCLLYLALAPHRSRTKERMVADLWDGEPSDRVKRNFHPVLSETRKVLGGSDRIRHRQGLYSLDDRLELQTDLDRFLASAEQGWEILKHLAAGAEDAWSIDVGPLGDREKALRCLKEAWSLYRGPFLEGFDDPWILPMRERYQGLYVKVLKDCGRLALGLDYLTTALDAFRSLLLAEPFEEVGHIYLMEVYGRMGRRDLVRRQYIQLQDRLKELLVDPSPQAVEVYDRLMA